ncbi:MAG: YkgJ family cysteine cluster protein [Deltaproteobacteria bacterium]|nr:YkgJ family cysteine cluster protein [Deltaproteobacteria bacterium]
MATHELSEADALKQTILKDYPRLGPDSRFRFRCHSGLDCFNRCCADVNIVLTPYDVVRLRRRLSLGSTEFMVEHTVRPFTKEQKIPVLLLKMRDDEAKTCPFVTAQGCSVYADRPWACRMYPVGVASSQTRTRAGEEFYFVLQEDHCHGHGGAAEPEGRAGCECGRGGVGTPAALPTGRRQSAEPPSGDREWSIAEWMDDQGVADYDAFGELFKEVNLHPMLLDGPPLEPRKMDLYFMACYDLDRFRRFVFESRFLQTFDLAADHVEQMRTDDEALLRFGLDWLRFALFAEPAVKVNPKVLEAKRQALEAQKR